MIAILVDGVWTQTHRLCQPVPKRALEAIKTLESIMKLKRLTTIVLSILCQNVIMTDSQTSKYYVRTYKRGRVH